MHLVDRIRELCATAANAKDAVTAFHALQELRESARDTNIRRDIEAEIRVAPETLREDKHPIS